MSQYLMASYNPNYNEFCELPLRATRNNKKFVLIVQ